MRRGLNAAVDLLAWPILTTVAAVAVPIDGGRLLRWMRRVDSEDTEPDPVG